MIAVIRSELYRMATIRSVAVTLWAFCALGIVLSVLGSEFWALLAGVGAFGIGVTGVAQHFQHRTAILLYLGRPQRIRVLAGQLITAVLVSEVFTAVSGGVVLVQGNRERYAVTLLVAPLMTVLGAATAAVVRRATVLFIGFAMWILFVEAMYGRLEKPFPFSAYLDAANGDAGKTGILALWVLGAVIAAAVAVRRDLNAD
jgi:hypothetical protein